MTQAREGYYRNDYISYLESERETVEQLIDELKRINEPHNIAIELITKSLNRQLEELNHQIRKAREEPEE